MERPRLGVFYADPCPETIVLYARHEIPNDLDHAQSGADLIIPLLP